MATVKTPLQSYDASGQIGKNVVHFKWKGIHCIRGYVIPANPKTAAQIAVRTHFKGSVLEWHLTQATLEMNNAWKRWVERVRKPWTALNCFVGLRVKALQAGHIFTRYHTYLLGTVTATSIAFSIKGDAASSPTVWYGTSMTYTPMHEMMIWSAANTRWEVTLSSLTPSTVYYYWVIAEQANNDTQTGLFRTKTLAG